MTATLKTTIIQEPSSSVANITLGSTGGVAFGSSASLAGATSGTTTLAASAAASGTVTFPAGTGTAAVNGLSTNIVSGTVNAGGTNPFPASSGPTSVDFTGIPSWAKRITVMFKGVGLSASTDFQIQIGSGSVTTSGYGSSCATFNSGGTGLPAASFTSGFAATNGYATGSPVNGFAIIVAMPSLSYGYSSNIGGGSNNNTVYPATGVVTLAGSLDRVRITSVSGTALFNSGNINILWE